MFYFKVEVQGEVKACFSEIAPALEHATFYLQDAVPVTIVPVEMTVDEFLELTDNLA